MTRRVILGGSFNPVHIGHVALAEALSREPGVLEVFVIPAAQNPLKEGGSLLPRDLRWGMVQAAFRDVPKVTVLDLELRRDPPSYTFDTVTQLRILYPDTTLEIALGWDAFRDFPKWYRAEQLLEIAGLIVVPRAGASPHAIEAPTFAACLPPNWAERLAETIPGEWHDTHGMEADTRSVVRLLPLQIAEVSASQIWKEKRWDWVPEPARILLLDHLKHADAVPPADRLATKSSRIH
jgi:nicotinate (nicotinamide) nucleotide adenylyltransferase